MISERMGDFYSDNLIIYKAGPVNISISGWSEEITISTDSRWEYLLPEVLVLVRDAWAVKDENVVCSTNPIKIKLNYEILKLYIEHCIIFL